MDTGTRILIITNDEMVTLYYKLYFGIICTANKSLSDSDSQVQLLIVVAYIVELFNKTVESPAWSL